MSASHEGLGSISIHFDELKLCRPNDMAEICGQHWTYQDFG